MAGETAVAPGDPRARKLFSVTLLAETIRRQTFSRKLMGTMTKAERALAKRERVQTTPDMPLVLISDLSKAAGERVSVDMFHTVTGTPTMGDRKISGTGVPLTFDTFELKIDQARFPVSAGGKMTQKRTVHNLRKIAEVQLSSWGSRFNDQRTLVHLAGARGSQTDADWCIPLESHGEFSSIMINPVTPPTHNRRFFANDATSVSDIGSTDYLRLADLDRIMATLREQPFPPAPIKLQNDPMGEEMPFYCLYLSERVWRYFLAGFSAGDWRRAVSDATTRLSISKHPLFSGECGMWNGVLIKKTPRQILFNAGDMVKELPADATTATVPTESAVAAGITVSRSILLGGQALAVAWGDSGMGTMSRWTEELTDHGNALEIAAGQIDGVAKFRFEGTDSRLTDFGVSVIDSFAPDVNSNEGIMLANAIGSDPKS